MLCKRARQIDLAAFSAEREDPRFADFRAHYPLCPDCAPEVGRWSRLEAALRAERQSPAGAHPEEAELLAYVRESASLAETERGQVAGHLAECATCRSEAAVLGGFDFAALRASPSEAPRAILQRDWRERLSGWLESFFAGIPQPLPPKRKTGLYPHTADLAPIFP